MFENQRKPLSCLDPNYEQIIIVLRYFLPYIIHERREYSPKNIRISNFHDFQLIIGMVSLCQVSLKRFHLVVINTFTYWGLLSVVVNALVKTNDCD